jgi:DNA adenine methylase
MATPFLKWAGGKAKLTSEILSLAPPDFRVYHEPFLGGGAVFFGLSEKQGSINALLNDLNHDLIETYEVVRDSVEDLVSALASIAATYGAAGAHERSEFYYEQRSAAPSSPVERAARLIFLNKTCYNGLYRVNRKGEFNVPHGTYANPRILDAAGLRECSVSLRHATLSCDDFATACRRAHPRDLAYLDPPYQPLSATASFTSYTAGSFGEDQQTRLRDEFVDLSERGVAAILSNSDHPLVRDLYRAFDMKPVTMSRAINSVGAGRAPVGELLISNSGHPAVRQAFRSSPK